MICAIDLFSKYAFVVPLKDKKGTTVVNAFQSILGSSKRKPNKIWVDQGSEFCNNVFKKWLRDHDISMYSTHNEGKPVVAERFIKIKTEVDKLDIDKLVSVPNDKSLSNVVKNDLVKKTEYDKLVGKVENIDIANFISKTKYEKDGSDFEDKISKIDKKNT